MSVYFLVQIKMIDEDIYNKYLAECEKVFQKYNGKYLAVDESYKNIEGTSKYSRIVLIEFPDEDDFNVWYYSEEYQHILQFRIEGAICDSKLIHSI